MEGGVSALPTSHLILLPAAPQALLISPSGEHLAARPFLSELSPTPPPLSSGMKRTLSKAIMTPCLPRGSLQSSFTPLSRFHL